MRGIGFTLSRLPSARALIAGAAFLAGAVAPPALGQTVPGQSGSTPAPDETAMALPRLARGTGSGEVALPHPLSAATAQQVRHIFLLQARGRMKEAEAETERLGDPLLLGHILAQRYLGPYHHSTAAELGDWLARYADEPDAPAIYALLRRRLPPGATPPPAPASASLGEPSADTLPDPVPEETDPAGAAVDRNPVLDHEVALRAAAGNADAALRLIAHTRGMTAAYGALLRAEVAQTLFTQNRDEEALATAAAAERESHGRVVLAGYIAGLAAWRLAQPEAALRHFRTAARAEIGAETLRAAAAFWAARAELRGPTPDRYARWMSRAAHFTRTFYGQIARHILGLRSGLAWRRETLGEADIEAVASTPQGWRAFALLQVGQADRAEAELRRLWPSVKDRPAFGRAVMLVASHAGLIDLAAQLAALVQTADGKPRDFDRFPVPPLRPRAGFLVDPPLIYALTRQESNFDAAAVSPAGARGLMQLMPVTAGYIAGDPALAGPERGRLHEPALNLDLGQRYVLYLAQQDAVNNDLIRLLAAYNSGPGSLARWGPRVRDDGDPFLFIEAIPNRETRAFVQRVLAYSWIYASRLGLSSPSLDALAADTFPRFSAPLKEATLTPPRLN